MSDYSGLPRKDEHEKRAWSVRLAIVAFGVVALVVGALSVLFLVLLLLETFDLSSFF